MFWQNKKKIRFFASVFRFSNSQKMALENGKEKMRSSEWMRGGASKDNWIDNPHPSGPRLYAVKVTFLYVCGKRLSSLWDALLNARA